MNNIEAMKRLEALAKASGGAVLRVFNDISAAYDYVQEQGLETCKGCDAYVNKHDNPNGYCSGDCRENATYDWASQERAA